MKKWLKAFRLQTLPLSLAGVLAGTAIALRADAFDWGVFTLLIFSTVSLQILSNLANDYGDFTKGTDNANRLGPLRSLQSGALSKALMKRAIFINVFLCVIFLGCLFGYVFSVEQLLYILFFTLLAVAAIVAAIYYTMGKNPYGYRGWGDVFVFVFFGICSVMGSQFLYTQTIIWEGFFIAVAIGFLSVGVLNLNNLRDVANDKKSGKNTLVVKMGVRFGKIYHIILLVLSVLCLAVFAGFFFKSFLLRFYVSAVMFLSLYTQAKFVWKNKDPEKLNPLLKILALTTFSVAFFLLGAVFIEL